MTVTGSIGYVAADEAKGMLSTDTGMCMQSQRQNLQGTICNHTLNVYEYKYGYKFTYACHTRMSTHRYMAADAAE